MRRYEPPASAAGDQIPWLGTLKLLTESLMLIINGYIVKGASGENACMKNKIW